MAVFTEVKEVPKFYGRKNRLQITLMEIERSGFAVVKIDKQGYKDPRSQAGCYRVAIKRAGLNWVVSVRGGTVYACTGTMGKQ